MGKQDLATTEQAKRFAHRSGPGSVGPCSVFAAAVLTAVAALAFTTKMLPHGAVWPAISTLLFVFAALAAFVAWRFGRPSEHEALSYWDVAGALTLIGICAGALVDPDQLVRLVESTHRDQ